MFFFDCFQRFLIAYNFNDAISSAVVFIPKAGDSPNFLEQRYCLSVFSGSPSLVFVPVSGSTVVKLRRVHSSVHRIFTLPPILNSDHLPCSNASGSSISIFGRNDKSVKGLSRPA